MNQHSTKVEQSGAHPIHYGPAWSKPRKSGESFAACTNDEAHGTLTTHLPWVTCPDCMTLFSSVSERNS